jgi:glycosyltransferase involved in cell wall biosynthesis
MKVLLINTIMRELLITLEKQMKLIENYLMFMFLVNPSSYLEGIPKISLEALSKGLPIITTDSVGCKETVDHMENGIIISMKDSSSLVKAMEFMINCSKEKLQEMGNKSRLKALNEFDERMVINHYLSYLHLPLYIASEKKEIAAVS